MLNQLACAAAYLATLLVPAFLLLGIELEAPGLAIVMVIFVLPLVRPVTGNMQPSATPIWNESVATALERFLCLYGAALALPIRIVLRALPIHPPRSVASLVGLGL